MIIHLKATKSNKRHTTFSVFVNGANAGHLVMSNQEAIDFREVVEMGAEVVNDYSAGRLSVESFRVTGEWDDLDKDAKKEEKTTEA